MAADVLHVGFGVPYTASSLLYAVVLAAVFIIWGRTEKTLSIHSIDTPRREIFYWLAVVATFAMGTALGDFTATTLHLGYLASGFLFAAVIAIPAIGFRLLRWNAIFSFWFAYVATRPLGASFADYLGKPKTAGGLGLGDGPVALELTIVIAVLVAFLAVTRRDVQGAAVEGTHGHGAPPAGVRAPAADRYARSYPGGPAEGYAPRPDGPRPDDRTMDYRRPRPDDRTMDYPPQRPGERGSDYPPPRPGNQTADSRRPRPDDPGCEYRRPR
jgi:Repeat of Unknown Function (DUF347)